MEIGFDQKDWRTQPAPGEGAAIDWHALRARLTAGYAARNALRGEANSARTARCGCFDLDSARSVAAWGHALADVNQPALGNGNSETAMDGCAADTSNGGGRG